MHVLKIARRSLFLARWVCAMLVLPWTIVYAQTEKLLPAFSIGAVDVPSSFLSDLRLYSPEAVLSIVPGASNRSGLVSVRGRASWEFGTVINGFDLTNIVGTGHRFSIIPEATQRTTARWTLFDAHSVSLRPQSVDVELKRAGRTLETNISASSDRFGHPGGRFVETTVQGEDRMAGVLSGPIGDMVSFVVAGELFRIENKDPLYLRPFSSSVSNTDALGFYPEGTPLPGLIGFTENFVPGNQMNRSAVQTSLTVDAEPVKVELLGLLETSSTKVGNEWPYALTRSFSYRRAMRSEMMDTFLGLRASTTILNEVGLSFSAGIGMHDDALVDPDFGQNWTQFPDSLENARRGYSGFTARYGPPRPYSIIVGFQVEHENAPNTQYTTGRETSRQLELRLDVPLGKSIAFTTGVHFRSWTARRFTVLSIPSFDRDRFGYDGMTPMDFPDEGTRRERIRQDGLISNYGFSYEGTEETSGTDAPFSPELSTVFVNIGHESQSARFGLGLRVESSNVDTRVRDASGLPVGEQVRKTVAFPRVKAEFDVFKDLTLEAGISGSTSTQPLRRFFDLHGANPGMTMDVAEYYRLPFNLVLDPVIDARTTTYAGEVSATGRWKYGFLRAAVSYRTDDEYYLIPGLYESKRPTAYGRRSVPTLDVQALVSPLDEIRVQAWYMMARVDERAPERRMILGTIRSVNRPGEIEYVPRHSGRIAIFFFSDPGEAQENTGLQGIVSVFLRSGVPYTRVAAPQNPGTAGPWSIGVRYLSDARSRIPDGPLDGEATPWRVTTNLALRYEMQLFGAEVQFTVQVQNLFDSKEILDVYRTTGKSDDDGWLSSPYAESYLQVPSYGSFYRAINLDNRWAYSNATGEDMFGIPRRLMAGISIKL